MPNGEKAGAPKEIPLEERRKWILPDEKELKGLSKWLKRRIEWMGKRRRITPDWLERQYDKIGDALDDGKITAEEAAPFLSRIADQLDKLEAAAPPGIPPEGPPPPRWPEIPSEDWGEFGLKQPTEFQTFQEQADYLKKQLDLFSCEDRRFNAFVDRAFSYYIANARGLAEKEGKTRPEVLNQFQALEAEYKMKTGWNKFWYEGWLHPEKGVNVSFKDLVGIGRWVSLAAIITCLSNRERVLSFHTALSSKEAIEKGYVSPGIEKETRLLVDNHVVKFKVRPEGMKKGVWNARNPEWIFGHMLQRFTLATLELPHKEIPVPDKDGTPLLYWDKEKKKYVPFMMKAAITADYEAGRNRDPWTYMHNSYPEVYKWRWDLIKPQYKTVKIDGEEKRVIVGYKNHADIYFYDFWHSYQMINFWMDNYDLIGEENREKLGWDIDWFKTVNDRERDLRKIFEQEGFRPAPPRPSGEEEKEEAERIKDEMDWQRRHKEWWLEMIGMGKVTEDWLKKNGLVDFFNNLLAHVYPQAPAEQLKELREALVGDMPRVELFAMVFSHAAHLRSNYMESLKNLDIHAKADEKHQRVFTYEEKGKQYELDYFLDWSNPKWKEKWDFSALPTNLSAFYKQQHYMMTTMREHVLKWASTSEFRERQKLIQIMMSETGCRHLGKTEFGPLREKVLSFFFDEQSQILRANIWARRKTGERNELVKDVNTWSLFGLDRGFAKEYDFEPLEIPTVWSEIRSPADLTDKQKAGLVMMRFDLPEIFEKGAAQEMKIGESKEITGKVGDFPGYEAMLAFAGLKVAPGEIELPDGKKEERGPYYQTEEIVGMFLETVKEIRIEKGPDGEPKVIEEEREVARPKKMKVWRANVHLDKLGIWRRERKEADPKFNERRGIIQEQMRSWLGPWFTFMEPKDRDRIICQWINAYFNQAYDKDPNTYIEREWGPTRDDWVRQGGDMIWQEKEAEPRFGFWHVYNWRQGALRPGKGKYIVDQPLTTEIEIKNQKGERERIEIMKLNPDDLPQWHEGSGYDVTQTRIRGSGCWYPAFVYRLTPLFRFWDEDVYMRTFPPIWEASFWQEGGETVPINWYASRLYRHVMNPAKRALLLDYLGPQTATLDPDRVDYWRYEWRCSEVEVGKFRPALASHRMPDVEGNLRTDLLSVDVQQVVGDVPAVVPVKAVGILTKIVPWGRTSQEIAGQAKCAAINFGAAAILTALTAINPGLAGLTRIAWGGAAIKSLIEAYLVKDTATGYDEPRGGFRRLYHYGWKLGPIRIPGLGIGGRKHHLTSPQALRELVDATWDDGVPHEPFAKAFFVEPRALFGRPTMMEYSF